MLQIRLANAEDFEWVAEQMHDALKHYYDGDHKAHARRIFETHINGRTDANGFFSMEQVMFICEVEGTRAAILHLVGKRQATYKISPLIVAPEFRGAHGLGSKLVAHAEEYAKQQGARHLYCTVADKNAGAMQFFQRKGFVPAGRSEDHYKNGVIEVMLYKDLRDAGEPRVVRIVAMTDEMKPAVQALILSQLPNFFDGIDEQWVNGLFAGYERRSTGDINTKFKLVYVALNENDQVVGVAGATPKKGCPIKVMPFVASIPEAYEALATALPDLLRPYGHKLYIHAVPSSTEVAILQRLGWTVSAMLPDAYKVGVTTQQWGLHIRTETMKELLIKRRYFDFIKSGQKPLEVRVGYNSVKAIEVGEEITMRSDKAALVVRVKAVRTYQTFQDMFAVEPFANVIPDAKNADDALRTMRKIYPPAKEKLGVYVFEVELPLS